MTCQNSHVDISPLGSRLDWLIDWYLCTPKKRFISWVSVGPTSILSDTKSFLWHIFEKPKVLARDVFETSQKRHGKGIFFEIYISLNGYLIKISQRHMPAGEIALWHGCSAVNRLHIFRTTFLKNTCGWLLPYSQVSVRFHESAIFIKNKFQSLEKVSYSF